MSSRKKERGKGKGSSRAHRRWIVPDALPHVEPLEIAGCCSEDVVILVVRSSSRQGSRQPREMQATCPSCLELLVQADPVCC